MTRVEAPRAATGKAVYAAPTHRELLLADARQLSALASRSLHLVVASPPRWTLMECAPVDGQLGSVEYLSDFLAAHDQVWPERSRAHSWGSGHLRGR